MSPDTTADPRRLDNDDLPTELEVMGSKFSPREKGKGKILITYYSELTSHYKHNERSRQKSHMVIDKTGNFLLS